MLKRYLLVATDDSDQVINYLPANYEVVQIVCYEQRSYVLVAGRDRAGWTLDHYVRPRLASGLLCSREIDLSHPVMVQVVEGS